MMKMGNTNATESGKVMDGQELPDWVPAAKLWSVFSTFGFSLCSFVVNFERKECHVLETGTQFYSDRFVFDDDYTISCESTPVEERRIMVNRIKVLRSFVFSNVPVADRDSLSFVEHVHVCWNGIETLVARKFFPLDIDDEGKARIGLFIMTPSPNSSYGEFIVLWGNRMWTYESSSDSFQEQKKINFSDREKQMLMLSISGVSIKNIAKTMEITESTAKTYRDRLFKKINANSMLEAITNVFLYKLW